MFNRRKKKAQEKPGQTPPPASKLKNSLLSLEQRLMFDAAAAATASEVASEQVAQEQAEAAVSSDGIGSGQTTDQRESQELLQAIATYAPGESTTEIAFVDPTVPDYQAMIAGMGPNVEVVVLDGTRDGMEQIAESLAGRSGVDAIHLISHGSAGELQLGTGTLTAESMSSEYADEFATIRGTLSDQADILVYGCNFGEGAAGGDAVNLLAELTGADVAASSDQTGHIDLGGDWDFEVQAGSIETDLALTDAAQMNWAGLLGTETVSDTFSAESYSNNNGTQSWSTSWSETDASGGGASGGDVRVNSSQLRIDTDTVGNAISRGVNLSNASSATLTFAYTNSLTGADRIEVRVSTDGGANYQTLSNGIFSNAANTGSGTASLDLSSYLSANTRIQFIVTATGGGERLYVDNVQVSYQTNNAPTVTSNGGGATASISVAENTTTVTTVAATDADTSQTLTYSISGGADAAKFAINSSTGALSFASAPNYEAPTDSGGNNVYDVTVQVSDGQGGVDSQAMSVTVTNVANEAPINMVPGAQTTLEDTSLVFSSTNGNQIAITDPDGSSGTYEVTLSVTNGSLSLSGVSGLTFTSGDGTGDSTMTLRGTVADINTALNGLSFAPTSDSSGSATLTLATRDSTLVSLDIDSNLQARYTFQGNANDMAPGTAQNGTLTGGASIVTDATRGQVVQLDGVNDSVVINSTYGNPSNVTLAGWVNLDALEANVRLFSIGESAGISLDYSGVGVSGFFQDGSGFQRTNSNVSIAGTGWHHITYAINDTENTQTIYIDGIARSTTTFTGSIDYTGATQTFIGQKADGNSITFMAGKVDDARIYDRALSVVEIAALANDLSLVDTDTVAITVNAVNDGPSFTSLNGAPTYTEGGSPVVLDSTVTITDTELTTANNFNGATLTLSRDGGASSQDVFSGSGTLSLSSGNVMVGSTTIGTYTNSGGTLAMTFNGNATNTLVNSAMQQITYSNSSDAPPSSVQVNWTFNDGNSSSQGSGGALTATGSVTVSITAVNDAPTDLSLSANSVAENALNGTVVGTISGTDPDSGDTKTYSLADTAGGRFAINSSTGQLTVADSSLLNYESATSHSVTVRVTDSGGLTYDETFAINLTNANETPTDLSLSANTVAENAANGTVIGTVSGTDVDSGDTKTYSFTDSAGGRFAINSSTGQITVADGSLLNYESATSHTVTVQVTDSGGLTYDETFTINLTNVNETPTGADATVTINEDTPHTFTTANFGFSDVDAGDSLSAVRIDSVPTAGTLTLSGISVTAGQVIAVTDIAAGNLLFTPAADATGTGYANVTFSVQDSGNVYDAAPNTLTIDVTAVNDAPVNAVPGAQSVAEDTPLALSGISVNDVDGNLSTVQLGVLSGTLNVTLSGGATISAGNNGTNTLTLSGSQVDINATLATLVYQGTSNYSGSDTLTVTSTDTNSGTDVDTVAITVTGVNDAPVVTAIGPTVTFVEGGSPQVIGPLMTMADVDSTNLDTGVLTISLTQNGTADDRLLVGNFGTGPGQVSTSGSNVSYEGVVIGTFTGGTNDSDPLVITFNANATVAAVQEIVTSIQFQNVSENPSTATRQVTFELTDGDGGTATPATKLVNVQATNDAPTDLTLSANTVAENAVTGTVVGFVTGTDADTSDTKTYTLTDAAGGRFAINSSTGQITVADGSLLNYEIATNHTVTVRVTDSGGLTYDETFTINLTNVNEAPTGVDATVTINEDTPHTFTTTNFGFSDVDAGDSLSAVRIDSLPSAGTLTLSGVAVTAGQVVSVANITAGNLVFTPAANATGSGYANLTFSVRDSNNAYDTTPNTLTINVTAVNDAPILNTNEGASVDEGASIILSAKNLDVVDVDNGASQVLYTITSLPINGTILLKGTPLSVKDTFTQDDIDSGIIEYQHDGSETDSDSFAFVVNDGAGGSLEESTFKIAVTPVNDAPTDLSLSSNTVAENAANGTVVGIVSGTDPDSSDTKTYSLADTAGGRFAINSSTGQITVANGSLLDYESTTSHSVTVRVTDSGGLTYDETFTINLTNVNEAPTGADATVTITEDSSHTFTSANFGFSDVDAGDSLSAVRIDTLPAAGTLTLSGVAVTAGQVITVVDITAGNLVFTPAANATGTGYANLTFSVRDSGNVYDAAPNILTIDVTAVNDAPVNTVPGAQSVTEDTALALSGISVNDVDGNLSTVQLGVLNGTVSVTLQGGASISAGNNGTNTLTLSGSQVDINATLATLVYQGALNYTGADTLTVTSTDMNSGTDVDTVTLTVTAVNDATMVTGGTSGTGTEDTIITGTLTATDVEGLSDGTVFSVTGAATQGTASIDPATGLWSYQPTADWNGTDSFTVTITDDAGNTTTQVISVTMTPVVDLTNDSLTTAEDTAISANVLTGTSGATADSFEGTPVLTGVTQGANGSVTFLADGTVTYTPNANFNGTDSFTYTITSGGVTETATVTVTVNAVNDATVVTGGTSGSGTEDTTITGTLTATDAEGLSDGTVFSVTGAATQGTASIDPATGLWSYTPTADWNGTDSFTVTITDDAGNTTIQVITVTVTAVNDAPVLTANTGSTVAEGDTDTIVASELAVTDVDTTDAQLTYTIGTGPIHGQLELISAPGVPTTTFTQADIAGNRVVYVHDGSETTSDSFTFTMSDGAGGSLTATTVTLTITPVNDAPTITSNGGGSAASINVAENVSAVTIVTGADVDLPSQVLTYSLNGGADQALFTIDASTGALNFAAPPDFEVATDVNGDHVYVVQVQVIDSQGASTTQMIQVTVTDVAETVVAPSNVLTIPPVLLSPSLLESEKRSQPVVIERNELPASLSTTTTEQPSKPAETAVHRSGEMMPSATPIESPIFIKQEDIRRYDTAKLEPVMPRWDDSSAASPFTIMPVEPEQLIDSTPPEDQPSISDVLLGKLDAMAKSLEEEVGVEREHEMMVARVAALGGTTLSVGFVAWAVRSSAVLASCLTTLPVWKSFDPLAVTKLSRQERERRRQATDAAQRQEQDEFGGLEKFF